MGQLPFWIEMDDLEWYVPCPSLFDDGASGMNTAVYGKDETEGECNESEEPEKVRRGIDCVSVTDWDSFNVCSGVDGGYVIGEVVDCVV